MPTIAQKRTLAIIPKVTGFLSMFGSGCIIYSTIREDRKKRGTYHRILLGMSCYDFICSFCMFLTTWPIPKGSPGVWNPSGNQATCSAQGFGIATFAPGVAYYNTALAIYYVLITRFKWSEDQIRAKEKWMHLVPALLAIPQGLAGFPLKLYNNANLWCWVAPFPSDCKDSARYGAEANCVRGDNAWIYRFAFTFGPVWLCIILSMVCMLVVYRTVLKHEKEVDKVQEDGVAIRKRSKRVAWQAFWYVLAFYVTWLPPTLTRLLQTIPPTKGKFFYPLILFFATLLPMQGSLNFIVFSRSRYLQFKREFPRGRTVQAIGYAAFSIKTSQAGSDTYENIDTPSALATNSRVPTEAILKSEMTACSGTELKPEKKANSVTSSR